MYKRQAYDGEWCCKFSCNMGGAYGGGSDSAECGADSFDVDVYKRQFQNTQFQLADMATKVECAQLLVYKAAMAKATQTVYSCLLYTSRCV